VNHWIFSLFHVWILLFSAGTALLVVVYAWNYRGVTGGNALIIAMISITIWTFFDALEAAVVETQYKIFFSKLAYIGLVNAPASFYIFTLNYTRQVQKIGWKRLLLLWAVPILTLGLVWTNEFHNLVWSGFYRGSAAANILVYEHGPWYWIFTLYLYAVYLLVTLYLLRAYLSASRQHRRQYLALFIASASPAVTGIIYVFQLSPIPGLDWSPVGAVATSLAFAWSIFRQNLLNLVPVAREVLVEQMLDGAVVLNNQDRIVDLNSAAIKILSLPPQGWMGRPVKHLFADPLIQIIGCENGEPQEIETHPGQVVELRFSRLISGNNNQIGRLLILRDITARKLAQRELQEANRQLTSQLVEIHRLQELLHEEAIRDMLTGLFNRRYMHEMLERELSRARRENRPVALIFFDLDHFKQVNDSCGHVAGDKVLQRLGSLIRERTRREDIACRYGGEEFMVILPGTTLEGALARADELRLAFAALSFEAENLIHTRLTFSAGVAAFPENGQDTPALLAACDRALYKAKSNGRNRAEIASEIAS
jgi:diguanylate cyclase (GGDEF)-like protein